MLFVRNIKENKEGIIVSFLREINWKCIKNELKKSHFIIFSLLDEIELILII